MHRWRRYCSLSLLLCCAACSWFKPSDKFGAREISYEELPGWYEDDHSEALATFLKTCPILSAKARGQSSGSGLQVPEPVWGSLCGEAQTMPPENREEARLFFERRFIPFRVNNNGREQGLFTGYYEPMLYGSYKKKGDFLYPVYLPPPDLKKGEAHFTHAEINEGVLEGRKLELIWVDDPVMLFFTQIQGSGRVLMTDNKRILIGYAGQNGHPYTSIGKVMADEGLLAKDQINFFTLRQWLYDHPDQAFSIMERNPSYVFFKRLDRTMPVGAVGAEVTPQRTLAVDSKYIPYGLPLFLEVDLPPWPGKDRGDAFNRTMIAQDTGGAIRGPVRGDIFFGGGDEAEYLAGYMKGRGMYNLLVPREVAYLLQ